MGVVNAYYNEIDSFAAEWLRQLIRAGVIAPGDVDERDVRNVRPADLKGYTQCHFFAGIGVWSYALRSAGWEDSRPVWTGSCPCQPFSNAGKRAGLDDERHLWPYWFHLISECKPRVVFGEQVEAAIRQGWLDLVQADMESIDYAFAAVDIPAAGFGAPHLRQRLYFCADSEHDGRYQQSTITSFENCDKSFVRLFDGDGGAGDSGHPISPRLEGYRQHESNRGKPGWLDTEQTRLATTAGATRGFWGDCDWWSGKDGKYRPIEPGVFPLAHGLAARVGRLRGYGNAIVAPVAQAFIQSYLEAIDTSRQAYN